MKKYRVEANHYDPNFQNIVEVVPEHLLESCKRVLTSKGYHFEITELEPGINVD